MFDEKEETIQEQVEPATQESTSEVQQSAPAEEKPIDRNWKQLRDKAERLERERDEAIRYAQDLHKKQQPAQEEDNEVTINPDELVEGKHLSRVNKKIQKLEQEVQKYQKLSQESTVELQLRSQFPDFDKVVTQETLQTLRENDPELAESINYNPNLYNKAAAAYKAIKKMAIYKEDTYEPDRERAAKNAAKPKPLSTISPQQGDTPLSHANAFAQGLTDDLKKNLWKEMEEARKNL
jgi:hypothetical protein